MSGTSTQHSDPLLSTSVNICFPQGILCTQNLNSGFLLELLFMQWLVPKSQQGVAGVGEAGKGLPKAYEVRLQTPLGWVGRSRAALPKASTSYLNSNPRLGVNSKCTRHRVPGWRLAAWVGAAIEHGLQNSVMRAFWAALWLLWLFLWAVQFLQSPLWAWAGGCCLLWNQTFWPCPLFRLHSHY